MSKSLFSIQKLYQVNPDAKSLQSYQSLARKESVILRRNGRMPKHGIALMFLKELSPNDIISLRKKMFRVLKEKGGIEAVAKIGISAYNNGKTCNKVYFQFLLDDSKDANTLQYIFHRACNEYGLVVCTDYWIDYNLVDNGEAYFDCFTGHGYRVPLFRKELRIQRFYAIGKWYRKPKTVLWQEAIDCMLKGNSIDPDKSNSQSK